MPNTKNGERNSTYLLCPRAYHFVEGGHMYDWVKDPMCRAVSRYCGRETEKGWAVKTMGGRTLESTSQSREVGGRG